MPVVIDLLNVTAKLWVASQIMPLTFAKYGSKRANVTLKRLRNAAYHAQAGSASAAIEFPEEVLSAIAFIAADARLCDSLNSPTLKG